MCEKEILLKKIDELKQQVEQMDNEYPKYMLAFKKSKSEQYIVKFTSEHKGEVVAISDDPIHPLGHTNPGWTSCKDLDIWEEVTNPNKLCDKDLVECWDDNMKYARDLVFYDIKNNCVYTSEGRRDGYIYNNYRKLMPWEYPNWAIEAKNFKG